MEKTGKKIKCNVYLFVKHNPTETVISYDSEIDTKGRDFFFS